MLRADTQALWEHLQNDPFLAGFILIGGSALALHLNHRESEDLDFIYVGVGEQLPKGLPQRQLEAVYRRIRGHDIPVAPNDHPADVDEFDHAGMDIRDHQQNVMMGRVNVSFFMPDNSLSMAVRAGDASGARVADLDELFASKALVAANRSKTRDWFDLYHLMTACGYTISDFAQVYEQCAQPLQFSIALNRLCSGQPSISDEGFSSLLENPPSLEDMTEFFARQRDGYEVLEGLKRFDAQTKGRQQRPRGHWR